MRDFTEGSILNHLVRTASFIGFGLVVQGVHLLVDMYFVSRLGEHVLAGVATNGSVLFMVMGVCQMVSIGTVSLVAQATGRRNYAEAQRDFDQGLGISLFAGAATLVLGYTLGGWMVSRLAADVATSMAARQYLYAFLPSLALMYPTAAIGSALRANGIVGVPMAIQSASVVLNIVLAPLLITGWGTGLAWGAAGAGLASSIAAGAGIVTLLLVFRRLDVPICLQLARPNGVIWRRIAAVGLPASGEFLTMFAITTTIYLSIGSFGAEAQAGYGVGARIMQSIFLPTLAIAFAIPPIAGTNFGAGKLDRVKATFATALLFSSVVMLGFALLCQLNAELLVGPFTPDTGVRGVAVDYLRAVSWNFVGISIVYCCSATFQGLGNTMPALYGGSSRLLTFVLPLMLFAEPAKMDLEGIWWLTNISVAVHVVIVLALMKREFRSRLRANVPDIISVSSTKPVERRAT
jgi:putative MATE family efflux protein